ncbi:ATP-dependent DNA ligase [Halostreptopolyspora alba]|uniref:ATP-dependent DNA ligase n=1 Tax=Halostreptopolyspora alba TaxID=2487137 RepID=A0A3N0EB88_9ACTN|nr:ATP-dependent DNA ligase [Nocardiopsaceae bacterium YIM 96095]
MLARTVHTLPEGPEWRYEPKWDGFRAIANRENGRTVVTSRSGRRLDTRFPEIAEAVSGLLPDGTSVDGEIVRWSGEGLEFGPLQRRTRATVRRARQLATMEPCHLVVFDVLRREGADLARQGLQDRREELERMFGEVSGPVPVMLGWQTTDPEEARTWFEDLVAVGIEGLIIKDARGTYQPGCRDWMKLKHRTTTEAVVGGVGGRVTSPDSLVLGRHDPDTGELRIVGRTTELTRAERRELAGLLSEAGEEHPWPVRLPARWGDNDPAEMVRVRPELVVEVETDTETVAERWRHVVRYVRPRTELDPRDVPTGLDVES